jgi:RIO kinase 1
MRNADDVPPPLRDLMEDQIIDDVVFQLKSGKEATVYVAEKRTGGESVLYAAKVYRDMHHRSFHRDEVYREGRVILDSRLRTAVRRKTRMGRQAAFGMWVGEEATMLRRVYDAGADVPAVIVASGPLVLMEYIGDADGPAPMLTEVDLSGADAEAAFDAIMENVETFLAADVRPVIIDLPQAVDARSNRHARELLARDIGNICRHFRRQGVQSDPDRLTWDLWSRYELGKL